ncbi:MAG: hypothetical protein ABIF01_05235 [Candidatus Micrarchaeota archaeon]
MEDEKASFGLKAINEAWKDTCRVVLRGEIGELDGYAGYLTKYLEKRLERKSAISGKSVVVASAPFCKSAKFLSNDEMEEFNSRMRKEKLGINDIKDIDSAVQALGEKLYYGGNIFRGKSTEVYDSDLCLNSSFIYKSSDIYDSKYIGYSCDTRYGNSLFGCSWVGECQYVLKGYEIYQQTRCMDTLRTYIATDCYYVANLEECNGCMFSFNQRTKRNLIGNIALPKDEYARLRDKLIDELRETIMRKKTLPSIVDIIGE